MSQLRTLVTLPIAAATAFLIGAPPASAAPAAAAPAVGTIEVTPSPVLDVYLGGACEEKAGLGPILAMQRINWMWAPMALDNQPNEKGERKPLPKVLVPKTMTVVEATAQWRARHDLVPLQPYTAPGPKPTNPITCNLRGLTEDGRVEIIVTGTLVTIPAWLDALLPPIRPPA